MAHPEKYPFYKIEDREGCEDGSFRIYKIMIDSDDGRAYEKLSTDAERLDYMRAHAHDSWKVAQVDSVFYEDRVEGKTYIIKKDTPEYEGLKKLHRKDDSSWLPGTKEFDDMVQYYKDYATSVEERPSSPCK
ncbi:hypothetical protein F5Y04DRAFT_289423 [Hypomontagnella monticulosa]|nr:hypothetical protein F5Y04DRAFT_289423 [Hypomontagnella monticulosa]